jgi:UDP-2,3-diacylglucosamine hydrolase
MNTHEMPDARPAASAQPNPVALFVSDVHLQEAMPRTTNAFLRFLTQHASRARQLYVLGDLFEYWAGDDDLDAPFNALIASALRTLSGQGIELFWVAGNRDFLTADTFARTTGMIPLAEPHIVAIGGHRIVMVHGDAQCTDDHAYMAFRAQVRAADWQSTFLALPLAQRKTIIAGLRAGSREAQRAKGYDIMDVNPDAIAALFESSGADVMIHGHTHRPALHVSGDAQRSRYVLPDWDCDEMPARGGWIAVHADGAIRQHDLTDLDLPTRTAS